MKEYAVTIDGQEYMEVFNPENACEMCEKEGAYELKDDYNKIGLCEEHLLSSYEFDKVRVVSE